MVRTAVYLPNDDPFTGCFVGCGDVRIYCDDGNGFCICQISQASMYAVCICLKLRSSYAISFRIGKLARKVHII